MSDNEKQPTRAFTHAEIVAFFDWVNAVREDRMYTLEKVSLLPDITPGGWQLSVQVTKEDASIYFLSLLVIQCTDYDGKPSLTYARTIDLPEGMASPSEEDAEIERQRLARLAKWEEERKQRDGNHNVPDSL